VEQNTIFKLSLNYINPYKYKINLSYMAKLITDPQQLVIMNRQIKRRLDIDYDSESLKKIVDCHGTAIKATPISMPHLISVSQVEFPFGNHPNYPEFDKKPFLFRPDNGEPYFLDRDEVALLLGTDYCPENEVVEINAALKACTEGPDFANSYILGINHVGVHKEKSHVVIPVQYYRISRKDYERLSIENSSKDGLERMLEKLKGRESAINSGANF
jgi:hypothetical protein